MWNYYCSKCNKLIEKNEIDIRENGYEGNYDEFHLECDTELVVTLKT